MTTFAEGAGQSTAASGCGALAPRLGPLPGRFWAAGAEASASGVGSTLGASSHAVAAIARLMAAARRPVARMPRPGRRRKPHAAAPSAPPIVFTAYRRPPRTPTSSPARTSTAVTSGSVVPMSTAGTSRTTPQTTNCTRL
jgi:hypothetical protein